MSKRKTVLPSHMKKTIERVEELATTVDLVMEVVDARAPHSSRCPILTRILAGSHHVKILSKTDLADPVVTNQWKQEFHQKGNVFADLPYGRRVKSEEFLSRLHMPFQGQTGRMVKALIIGIPNVGKSTLINLLAGKHRAHTGARPGITRGLQLITLGKGVFLYDSPGVINPVIRDEEQGHILGLIGCLQENLFDAETAVTYLATRIIQGGYLSVFGKTYELNVDGVQEPLELLELLARRRGCMRPGGSPDIARACNILLRDFSTGRLCGMTLESPISVSELDPE